MSHTKTANVRAELEGREGEAVDRGRKTVIEMI